MNVIKSFQGCLIAVAPIVVGILVGVATYTLFTSVGLPKFPSGMAALSVGSTVYLLAEMLRKKMGANNERK